MGGLAVLIEKAPQLEAIALNVPRGTKLTDRAALLIAAAPTLVGLRRLSLEGHDLTRGAVLESLSGSQSLRGIEELSFHGNRSFDYPEDAARILAEAGFDRLRDFQSSSGGP